MQDTLLDDLNEWEEEWLVTLQTKSEYILSAKQALILKQAIANNNRQVMFESFYIPIPYIVDFYRKKRFRKNQFTLPVTASDKEYEPISEERWAKIKKDIYGKIGRSI